MSWPGEGNVQSRVDTDMIRMLRSFGPHVGVFPEGRHSSERVGGSLKGCQNRKWPNSFDHLGGAGKELWRLR